MMSMHRRDFISSSAIVLAGLGLGVRTVSGAQLRAKNAESFLQEPLAPDLLRQLSAQALDAARGAGAQYADVRVGYFQRLTVGLDSTGVPVIGVASKLSYGIRAMVNGAVGFDYGDVPTADAVAVAARNATTQARGYAMLFSEPAELATELAPAPAVQGEWGNAVKIDPFTVPILEQADLLGAYGAATGGRIEGVSSGGGFDWERETRVCATTEGTRVTQTFIRARPGISAIGSWMGSGVGLGLPNFGPVLGGYEYVIQPGLHERIKEHGDTVIRYARMRSKTFDVGRYPIVFDGQSTATLLNYTLGPALQMDRVLGMEADASGGSFLSPHTDVLGTPIFSSLVSISASRPETNITGAKWDDEGVAVSTKPVPLVDKGRVVDYLTDRQTAPALREWYTKRGAPVQSHGFSFAQVADRPMLVGTGHLEMAPSSQSSSQSVSQDDLVRQIKHGLLLIQAGRMSTDQQLASGFLHGSLVLEVKDGQVTNRVRNVALQFKTAALWKGVTAIGDRSTLGIGGASLSKGQPWQMMGSSASAPAIYCTAIDVINVKDR